jgi:hypothetical protein
MEGTIGGGGEIQLIDGHWAAYSRNLTKRQAVAFDSRETEKLHPHIDLEIVRRGEQSDA